MPFLLLEEYTLFFFFSIQIYTIYFTLPHVLALKDDGTVWVVGDNTYGQLGVITEGKYIDNWIKVAENVKYIAASYYSSFIIKNDGSLWAAGDLNFLEKSYNNLNSDWVKIYDYGVKKVFPGDGCVFIMKSNDNIMGIGYGIYLGIDSKNLLKDWYTIPIKGKVKKISSCWGQSFILYKNGDLYGTGPNGYGELGLGDNNVRLEWVKISEDVIDISAGENHSLMIKKGNTLWATGANYFCAISLSELFNYKWECVFSDVIQVSSGSAHSIALTKNYEIFAVGHNFYSQIGLQATGGYATCDWISVFKLF